MDDKNLIKQTKKFSEPFRVTDGQTFRSKKSDPNDTLHLDSEDKPRAQEALANGVRVLAEFQDKLYPVLTKQQQKDLETARASLVND